MRKKKLIIITIIIVLLIIVSLIVLNINKNNDDYINVSLDEVYCNSGECYSYNGKELAYYQVDEEAGLLFENRCDVNKDCLVKVIESNDDILVIEKEGAVIKYEKNSVKHKAIDESKINLKGMFFANQEEELYFLTDEIIIIAGKNHHQIKETYDFSNYINNYIDINGSYSYYFDKHPVDFVYDIKNNSLLNFTKKDIKEAKYINISVYDNEGNVIMKPEYSIKGAYKNETEEIYINNDKAIIARNYLDDGKNEVINIEPMDVSKNYVYYFGNNDNKTIYYFVYNTKTKEICFDSLDDCYHNINISELELIKNINI